MYSFLTRRKRSLMERLFTDQNELSSKSRSRNRYRFPMYVKCALCILILYYLNLFVGFKSSIWWERSFEDEYYRVMKHIDVTKIEENAVDVLGPPTNYLPSQFLIENEYLCGRSLNPDTRNFPHLLILIKSPCENVRERQSIRLTWADKNRLSQWNIRLAFVLGTDAQNSSVKEEWRKYGDMIQIDKVENYYHSTHKMIMMLRWINDYCSVKSVRSSYMDLRRYVLFVDDDYYIHLDLLLSYLHQIDEDPDITTYERRTFITGELIEKSRPQRFVNDRWYVSMDDYPYNIYPPYVSSGCFLMTRYNVRLFYTASKYTRLFPFDEIYMGLLAYSMSINLIPNNELFSTSLSDRNLFNNQTEVSSRWKRMFGRKSSLNSTKNSICYRGYRAEKSIELWNDIHQTNLTLSFD